MMNEKCAEEADDMERIASFQVDHEKLRKGMYTARVDGDVVTYDIRMKLPNAGDYLPNGTMHSLEHLLASYMRNSPVGDKVVYVGPMGCRTGFYLLVRDSLEPRELIRLVQESLDFVADYKGPIPGNSRRECGNYREHDLVGAQAVARDMCQVLRRWTVADLAYDK